MKARQTDMMEILGWFLIFCGTVLGMTSDGGGVKDDLWDREDLYDRTTRKLKPVRQVVEDHAVKDFPKIKDCGPDETQNWYEPDPEDCSCYFVCTGKYYVHRRCTSGLFYDVKTQDCNWPAVVDCLDRPLPWVAPPYTVGPHYIHEHYNIFEYTNTKKVENQRENKTEAGRIDRWGAREGEVEDDHDEYEYDL